ncbi:MAG: hypothetical protein WEA34_10460 [Gemmatimonadota bacterium]
MLRQTLVIFAAGLIPLVACRAGGEQPEGREGDTVAASGRVVDSIFPMEEQIRRFQATVADTPTTFRGGSASRDGLVEAFLSAVQARDADALAALTMDRAEYAFLYYPYSAFARPPYELPPEIHWLQVQNTQSRSLTRLFQQLDERTLDPRGYRCDGEPVASGPIRIWENCFVLVPGGTEDVVEQRLFGSVLEHDGRFKFLSLSNEL